MSPSLYSETTTLIEAGARSALVSLFRVEVLAEPVFLRLDAGLPLLSEGLTGIEDANRGGRDLCLIFTSLIVHELSPRRLRCFRVRAPTALCVVQLLK
jgi:hypothetical protein